MFSAWETDLPSYPADHRARLLEVAVSGIRQEEDAKRLLSLALRRLELQTIDKIVDLATA